MSCQLESQWTIIFSANTLRVVAWGRGRSKDYVASNADLYLISHPNGTTYMAVADKTKPNFVLVFQFGVFWLEGTTKIWGSTILSSHVRESGLVLYFPSEAVLEQFQVSCDRTMLMLPNPPMVMTLQDLADLDIVTLPKIVGEFLAVDTDTTLSPGGLTRIVEGTADRTLRVEASETWSPVTEGVDDDDEKASSACSDELGSISDISSLGSLDSDDFALFDDVVVETLEDVYVEEVPEPDYTDYAWPIML